MDEIFGKHRVQGELVRLGHRMDNAGSPQPLDGPRPARDLSQVPDQGSRGPVHQLFRSRFSAGSPTNTTSPP